MLQACTSYSHRLCLLLSFSFYQRTPVCCEIDYKILTMGQFCLDILTFRSKTNKQYNYKVVQVGRLGLCMYDCKRKLTLWLCFMNQFGQTGYW